MELTATADEVLATVAELFPLHHQVAVLTLITRRQATRLAELEARPADDHG